MELSSAPTKLPAIVVNSAFVPTQNDKTHNPKV